MEIEKHFKNPEDFTSGKFMFHSTEKNSVKDSLFENKQTLENTALHQLKIVAQHQFLKSGNFHSTFPPIICSIFFLNAQPTGNSKK